MDNRRAAVHCRSAAYASNLADGWKEPLHRLGAALLPSFHLRRLHGLPQGCNAAELSPIRDPSSTRTFGQVQPDHEFRFPAATSPMRYGCSSAGSNERLEALLARIERQFRTRHHARLLSADDLILIQTSRAEPVRVRLKAIHDHRIAAGVWGRDRLHRESELIIKRKMDRRSGRTKT